MVKSPSHHQCVRLSLTIHQTQTTTLSRTTFGEISHDADVHFFEQQKGKNMEGQMCRSFKQLVSIVENNLHKYAS